MSGGVVVRRSRDARVVLSSFRAALLLGTALAAPRMALAENISSTGSTDYSLTRTDPISGGPRVVDITTTDAGNITLDLATVTADNSGNTRGAGIAANATGTGNVSVTSGTVTATGTGQTYAVDGRTTSGTIMIANNGTVSVSGSNNDRAIYARSTTGDITITSNEAHGQGVGLYTFTNGTTTINSTNATADGTGQINAIIGQGYRVVINSGTASNTNAAGISGTAIFANSDVGGVLVNAQTTNAYGQNQAAIQIFSEGAVDVTSGSILTTQDSDGLSVASGTVVVARSTSIVTQGTGGARGIVIGGNAGGGGFNSGVDGFAYNSVDVTSGTISTVGNSAYGIYVTPNGSGTTAITSGAITTTGTNAYGIYETQIGAGAITGDSTITTTGALTTSGASAAGIMIAAGTGAVSIANTGAIATSGIGSYGIAVMPTSGTTTISGAGTIATTGDYAHAIYLSPGATAYTGATSIATGPITTTGANAMGIYAVDTSGAVTIDASDIRTTGSAIVVVPVSGSTAPITVRAGIVRVSSEQAAINLSSNDIAGPLTVSVADSISAGAAVDARSAGAVSVTGGTVQVTGGAATGLIAISSGDSATVNSGTLAVTDNRGIFAAGLTDTSVISGTLTTTGSDYDYALIAQNTAADGAAVPGTVTVDSTTLTSGSGGITTSAQGAATTITSGTVTADGANVSAISAGTSSGTITINSGTATTSGAGSHAIFAQSAGGAISITSANATTTGAYDEDSGNTSDAILVSSSGTGAITINSAAASATGQYASAVFAFGNGNVTINSDVASSAGASTDTVGAVSRAGDVAITAQTTTASGAGAGAAIGATATTGNVTIVAGDTVSTQGKAISVSAGKLASVTAASAASNGDAAAGVSATGGTGVFLDIGAASSNGTAVSTTNTRTGVVTTVRADAVFAQATTGAVNATIGSATATGAGADGVHILANGAGGAANVAITGAVSAAQGTGLVIDPPGLTTVTIAQGASVSGSVAGIDVTSGTGNAIANAGTVSSTSGPAILASGATTLVNAGTITAGSGGVAVQLGATDDTVTLLTGSSVGGTIAGGGGIDRAVLAGTGTGPTATQTIAAFDGFDSLRVAAGYWTAGATPSSFNSATVDSGASLELANGATGITGITVPTITDNGTLVIRSSAASAGSTLGTTTISGTGAVTLAGTGTVTLDGTNSIATSGGITVANGATLLVTGAQGGTVTTQAGGTFQIGNGTTAGTFTGDLADNGTLVVNHADDYSFTGALTGTGTLVKQGAGRLILGSNYAFIGTTQIVAGAIKLTGTVDPTTQLDLTGGGTLDFSGTQQTVAELSGNNTAATINIAGGSLTVDQATNTAFAGNITGNGGFTKAGTGSLNFTGNSTYTGPTVIEGGRLAVNGSIVSAVTVESGATLGGTGTIGGATIVAGGIYAPGNSIGTQTVAGNVVFRPGSIYAVETNADGRSDRINATGTATLAGTVSVLAQAGAYANLTDYTILTAAGGVSGTFTNATSNLAFLTPLLGYGANAVTLTLARNDVRFAAAAATPNQAAVANAVQALGLGNAVYNSVLRQTAAGAHSSFDAFSGEVYAAVPSVLIDQGKRVRDAVLDRAGVEEDGIGVWGSAMRNAVNGDERDGRAATKTDRKGIVSGIDIGRNGLRIGAYGGYIDTDLGVVGRASHAGIKTGLAGGYAAWTGGRLSVKVGGDYDWHTVDVRRTVTLATGATQNMGKYDAHTLQAFGEIDYRLIDGPVTVTPFGAYAHVRTHSDGVNETGNAAALDVASRNRNVDTTNVGLRVGGTAPVTDTVAFLPKAVVSWQHGWGDLRGGSVASFGGAAASTFGVSGARLAGDAANAELGFDLAIGQHLRVGTGGYMSYSRDWSDYGGTVSIGFRF